MVNSLFIAFIISGFSWWAILFYVDLLLKKKEIETSLLFLDQLFKGMRKLSLQDKKYRNTYYVLIMMTIVFFISMVLIFTLMFTFENSLK